MFQFMTLSRYATFVAVLSLPMVGHAQCVAPKTMTGVWKSNDGGTYYVRESGRDIWWIGVSGDDGKTWTNVYKGVRDGAVVTGTWADVRGKNKGAGMLNLHVDGSSGVLGFSRREVSGGFAGKRWFQPCNDTP
jgi:hypothetical protein